MRVGIGYDVHKFVAGRKLILGGVDIPYQFRAFGTLKRGCASSRCDRGPALLGAAALGDIGQHFPDTDPQYEGISSIELLKKVKELLESHGYVVGNIDAIIVAQQPKMALHIPKMRENIANALGILIDRVSVKATTEEKLGFTGTLEGISSHAICLLENSSL